MGTISDDLIILEPYSENWPKLAAIEIERIRSLIPEIAFWRIEHIGSTAIPGLSAKPIIDLAIEVPRIGDGRVAIAPLESIEYSFWRENLDEKHLYFVKGLPPKGKGRTHHIHFFEPLRFREHTKFRELLLRDRNLAKAYEVLKKDLAAKFKHDREAYTNAKAGFIQAALKK